MRVLVISTMYPTAQDPTYGIYVKETVDNLKRYKNVDFHVIASFTSSRGILITPAKYVYSMIRALYSILRLKDLDLIHAHYILPAGLIALIPKYFGKKKLLVTAHGSDINILPGKNRMLWYLTRFVLKRADKIIVVSKPLYEKITAEFGIDEKKVEIITCGIDQEKFRPMDEKLCRKMLGLPLDRYIVFHLSSLDPVKRVDLLMDSFRLARKKDPGLYLVVGGSGRFKEQYMNDVERMGMAHDVLFTGVLDKNDVPLWMGAADVFLLASENEGTPVTVIEAMASGKCVVSTDAGGIPDVVGQSGLIVKDARAETLSEAIILSRKSGREAGAGRIRKSADYRWEILADKIYCEYLKIA